VEEGRNAFKDLVRNLEGKRLLGGLRRSWGDNIKICLKYYRRGEFGLGLTGSECGQRS
jgi:hypothetical protein